MKKIFSLIILLFYLTISIFYNTSLADDIDTDIYSNNIIEENTLETSNSTFPSINSRSYVVIDRKTNSILVGKNEHIKKKMASTTKIMTAIVIIENYNLDTIVEVSKKAANTGGSRLGLKTGDKISIRDLLYGLMLCSGNDAAVALAESTCETVSNFAILMNEKAKTLGLNNTHFVTPHGLDADEHYTTAYELALLSDYALKNKTFLKIVGTKNYTISINNYPKNLNNTNELLGNLNGVYGIKTGFTNGANRCLVSACKRNDMDIICVVLGADTKKFRTQDSIKLIEYTFNSFSYINIKEKIETEMLNIKKRITSFNIEKGTSQYVTFSYTTLENDIIPIENNLISELKLHTYINTNLIAPVKNGSIIGSIDIYAGDILLYSTNIITTDYIPKKNIIDYLYEFIKNYDKSLHRCLER